MDATSKLDIEEAWLELLQKDFRSARVTDIEMCSAINMVHDEFDYFVDPHTAVAVAAGEKLGYHLNISGESISPYAILSTASPCKFQESMTEAVGPNGWQKYYVRKCRNGGKIMHRIFWNNLSKGPFRK